jgi:hypothetical protein
MAAILGEWVHIDLIFQPFLNAALILLGLRAPVDENNPYANPSTQASQWRSGLATFGPSAPAEPGDGCRRLRAALGLVSEVVRAPAWLRPEGVWRLVSTTASPAGQPTRFTRTSSTLPRRRRPIDASAASCSRWPIRRAARPIRLGGSGHAVIGAGLAPPVLKARFREDWVLPRLSSPIVGMD